MAVRGLLRTSNTPRQLSRMAPRRIPRRIPRATNRNRRTPTRERAEMTDSSITGPAAVRAVNALLDEHYMITTSGDARPLAQCVDIGGAIAAVEEPWRCDR